MRIDDGVATAGGDVVYDCCEVGEVGGVEGGSETGGGEALHGEGDAEYVVAFGHECLVFVLVVWKRLCGRGGKELTSSEVRDGKMKFVPQIPG